MSSWKKNSDRIKAIRRKKREEEEARWNKHLQDLPVHMKKMGMLFSIMAFAASANTKHHAM